MYLFIYELFCGNVVMFEDVYFEDGILFLEFVEDLVFDDFELWFEMFEFLNIFEVVYENKLVVDIWGLFKKCIFMCEWIMEWYF